MMKHDETFSLARSDSLTAKDAEQDAEL